MVLNKEIYKTITKIREILFYRNLTSKKVLQKKYE